MLGAALALCGSLTALGGCGRSTHKPVELSTDTGSASVQSGQAGAPGEQALSDQALFYDEQILRLDDQALSQDEQALLEQLQERLAQELAERGIDADKAAAAAPSGTDNAVFDLDAEVVDPDGDGPGIPTGIALSWTEQLIGDYDQNSEVNAADITPLALYWHMVVNYDDPGLHGGFAHWPEGDPEGTGALNWRMSRVDGDFNGELNITDITPISVHWKEQLSGYLIERAVNYGTGVLLWDEQPLDIGFGTAPSAPHSLTFEPGEDAPPTDRPARYLVDVTLSDAEYAQQYRVRALDTQSGGTGEASNVVSYYPSAIADTTPPVWVDTVGAAALVPRHEALTVQFGTAVDDQSPPVSYRVYWAVGDPEQPDAPFDYEAADYADAAAGPYEITGLTDDVYYRAAVRAADSAGPPNREQNEVVLGETVRPTDCYAPEWTNRVGLQELFYGNDMAIVVFDAAVDSHTDAFGTWESGPVVYRVYYGEGETPNFAHAEYEDFPDIGLDAYVVPVRDLDTTKDRWFAVRIRDQAEYANEDDNIVSKLGRGTTLTEILAPEFGPGVPAGSEWMDGFYGEFVYSPDGSQVRYLALATDLEENCWASLWEFDGASFTHDSDVQIDPAPPKFSIKEITLSPTGQLQMLYYTKSSYWGESNIIYFQQATGAHDEYTLEAGLYFEMGYFDVYGQPWVILTRWNGELIDVIYEYYFISLPFDDITPFWTTPEDKSLTHMFFDDRYAILENGSIALPVLAAGNAVYQQLKAYSSGNGFNLEVFPGYTQEWGLSGAYGRNVSDAYWLEMSWSQILDYDWWHISGPDLDISYRIDPPLIENGLNLTAFHDHTDIAQHYAFRTTSWYENPEASSRFYVAVLIHDNELYFIPYGDITGDGRVLGITEYAAFDDYYLFACRREGDNRPLGRLMLIKPL